jgi:uncharacterized protein (DUF433 family)
MVSIIIVDNIAVGISREEIYASYPSVTNASIDAALFYSIHPPPTTKSPR